MTRFQNPADLNDAMMQLATPDDQHQSLFKMQHFIFGCCNRLRGFISWPIVKETYEKTRLGLGTRSMFFRPPNWRNRSAFARARETRTAQFVVYELLGDLQEYQDVNELYYGTRRQLPGIFRYMPKVAIEGIWKDTVETLPTSTRRTYPLIVRQTAHGIRVREAYDELPYVLGDMCYDHGLDEEANHFHDTTCAHTYACRYLHQICKGMDGK